LIGHHNLLCRSGRGRNVIEINGVVGRLPLRTYWATQHLVANLVIRVSRCDDLDRIGRNRLPSAAARIRHPRTARCVQCQQPVGVDCHRLTAVSRTVPNQAPLLGSSPVTRIVWRRGMDLSTPMHPAHHLRWDPKSSYPNYLAAGLTAV